MTRMHDVTHRTFSRLSALAAALLAASAFVAWAMSPVGAQEAYPNKPVKIIVGMPAGSFTDLTARWIGDELRAALGSSFIIENRPGAATNIASGIVARSPNDGYTLLLATNSNTMNPSLFKTLPFDVTKDFKPIAMIASSSFLILAHPSLPVKTLQELIDYAKANPGVLNIGSGGTGTATHLAIEMFAQRAGLKVVTVFYKSSIDTVTDLLGGRIQVAFAPIASGLPHVQAGALKALAVTSAKRSDLAPNVPTVAESGVPGYDAAMWTGLFAPAGTPPDIVDRLSAAATKAVASEDMQSKIKKSGGDPRVMGAKEFADYVEKDIVKWAETVKGSGIKPAD
jgi:tripartite-type tricarboxylate transporter receptor subunit TctC